MIDPGTKSSVVVFRSFSTLALVAMALVVASGSFPIIIIVGRLVSLGASFKVSGSAFCKALTLIPF